MYQIHQGTTALLTPNLHPKTTECPINNAHLQAAGPFPSLKAPSSNEPTRPQSTKAQDLHVLLRDILAEQAAERAVLLETCGTDEGLLFAVEVFVGDVGTGSLAEDVAGAFVVPVVGG